MASSYNQVVGTGALQTLAVPPYLDVSHIKVSIDKVDTLSFAWVNLSTISFTAPVGSLVRVYRDTSSAARLVDYVNGSNLNENVLDVDSIQAFFLSQEAADSSLEALKLDTRNRFSAGSRKITGVSTGTEDSDAVNLAQMTQVMGSNLQAAASAALAATHVVQAEAFSTASGVKAAEAGGYAADTLLLKNSFVNVFGGIGYSPPVAYISGLNLTTATQTVSHEGNTYAPVLSALPFTTSGAFEVAKFRLLQGVSGADLAAANGVPLLAYSSMEAQSILDNALPKTDYAALRAYGGRAVGVRIITPGLAPRWQVDASDTTSVDNGGTVLVDAIGRRWKPPGNDIPTIFQFGVVPGPDADAAANTIAFRNALDSAICVRVPFVDAVIKVTSNIGIKNGRRIIFDSEYMNQPLLANPQRGVVGDGSGPVFTTSVYPGGSNTNREIRLDGARVWNTGYACLDLLTSDDAKLFDCAFNSSNAQALKARYSARVMIRGGSYRSSFSTISDSNFAITAYDNCNGLTITPDTIISGGTNGGGADISLSQKISIDGIYEVCGTWGYRISGVTGTGAGNCNGVALSGYFEQCRRPISIGAANLVLGVELSNIYIGNSALPANGVLAPEYCIELGRVSGLRLLGGVSFHKKGTEPTFKFVQPSSGGGITDYLVNSTIGDYHEQGGGATFQNSLLSADLIGNVFGRNRLKLSQTGPYSGLEREYVTPPITANVGKTIAAFITDTVNGGVIDGVDILDATGTIGCSIRIGHSTADGESLVVDPSTLTLSSGAAAVAPTLALIRPAKVQTVRVVAGAGTGSFRVRIRYRL